jgi:hypothetical protein
VIHGVSESTTLIRGIILWKELDVRRSGEEGITCNAQISGGNLGKFLVQKGFVRNNFLVLFMAGDLRNVSNILFSSIEQSKNYFC